MMGILAELALIVWLVGAGRGIRGLAEAYLVRRSVHRRTVHLVGLEEAQVAAPFAAAGAPRVHPNYVLHFGGLVQFQSMLSIFLASVERVAALG